MLRYNNMRHRELPLSTDSSNLFLKVMISIAVFLFAVTLAGVLSINSMLVNWNSSILGSLTVQIIPVNGVDKLKAKNETLIQEQRAAAMLEAMPEVQKVTPLNDGQLERLLLFFGLLLFGFFGVQAVDAFHYAITVLFAECVMRLPADSCICQPVSR